ncbi:unnamed protein product [Pedinophyceae sp. YPF-701]|nr:unnamed protein product [Pedinophyceae sp. YPF-701]
MSGPTEAAPAASPALPSVPLPAVPADAVTAAHAAELDSGADGASDSDESWDEDEMALALEWADMREDHASAALNHNVHRPNAHGGAFNQGRARGAQLKGVGGGKGAGKHVVDLLDPGMAVSGKVQNVIKGAAKKELSQAIRITDKSQRATVEQALDPRTRMILFRWLNKGVFDSIHGCISTGKEANVYQATRAGDSDLAVKIYKTSILVFKDRDRYVSGDHRFKQGYCKSNPRKMVSVWAEKEFRNLSRLQKAGIRTARPVALKRNVLLMELIGEEGRAAPRLKDARLPESKLRDLYTEAVLYMRTMYQDCKLVHGDLSEYNILVFRGHLYVIDVSQAVDLDHPHALTFLREDCQHVNDFFRKSSGGGVAVLTNRELFNFCVDPSITPENLDANLDALMRLAAARPAARTAEDEIEDAVFQQAFIPKRLDEVARYERDHEAAARGEKVEGVFYQVITGMRDDLTGPQEEPRLLAEARERERDAVRRAREEIARGEGEGAAGEEEGGEGARGGEAREEAMPVPQGRAESRAVQAGGAIPHLAGRDDVTAHMVRMTMAAGARTVEQGRKQHDGAQDPFAHLPPPKVGGAAAAAAAAKALAWGGADDDSDYEDESADEGEAGALSAAAVAAQARAAPAEGSGASGDSGDESGEESGEESGDDEMAREWEAREGRKLTKEEVRELRKEHKRAVKAERAEKRKEKMPKKVKKQKEKKSKKKR